MAIVLVVDDSAVDQSLVEGILARGGEMEVRFADNGRDAMRRISQFEPDIIVTDLMMPEMDGLEVVKNVRNAHPNIPVIVMTALGTEETAIEALQVGAASFVPKARLADRLFDTVHQVLALKRADHPYRDVLQCLGSAEATFHLNSNLGLIPQFVDLVQRSLSSLSICDTTESIRLSLAFEEALLNALVHGNLELTSQVAETGLKPNAEYFQSRSKEQPYKDRKIFVGLDISRGKVSIIVRDEGPGFDLKTLPDEDDLSPFQDGVGRGLKLMRSFMDEVSYNAAGNEVTLVRHFAHEHILNS
jgi:CheY-like chemotaxis protein/anti-sigma regulatory factor (Ser/Thr protein kinase)